VKYKKQTQRFKTKTRRER